MKDSTGRCLRFLAVCAAYLCLSAGTQSLLAQASATPAPAPTSPATEAEPAPASPVPQIDLATRQQQLQRDYERFEKALFDVAEQTRLSDPDRADILYRARNQSQQENILSEMQVIAELLRSQSAEGGESAQYGPAADRQTDLLVRLEALMKLLQSLDERDRINADIERFQAYLKENLRLTAEQKDARAQTQRQATQGQGESEPLQNAQRQVGEDAQKLAEKIDGDDAQREAETQPSDSNEENASDSEDSQDAEDGDKGKPVDSSDSQSSDSQGSKPEDSDSQSNPDGPQSPMPGQPSESQPMPGSPQSGQPQSGQPQPGQPQSGQPSSQPQQQKSQQTPGREELEQARQQMQQALEKLLEENRDEALENQDDAVAKLEEMRAKLEEILRQLREEERESYLTILEARFQNMLQRQLKINTETTSLDAIPGEERPSGSFASRTDQVRKDQDDNADDAEKTLNLLKEEGSSVAFPEAVEQMHRNMRLVSERLVTQDTGQTTQLLEQLIVETLEEMITALRQELEKMQKDSENQDQNQQQGEPGEQSLVNQLAELRLIRSLQNQINRLTRQIGTELEAQQTPDEIHIQMLRDLAIRQDRLQKATYDLSVGRNK